MPRTLIFSTDFKEYIQTLSPQIREKYAYALEILKNIPVPNRKFVKHLENTDLYELRVSVSTNEYRTLLFAVDNDNIINSTQILLLNSFLKKSTKDYKAAIMKAEEILKEYI